MKCCFDNNTSYFCKAATGIESLIAKASVKLTHREQKVFVGISCIGNQTFEVRTENKCV